MKTILHISTGFIFGGSFVLLLGYAVIEQREKRYQREHRADSLSVLYSDSCRAEMEYKAIAWDSAMSKEDRMKEHIKQVIDNATTKHK